MTKKPITIEAVAVRDLVNGAYVPIDYVRDKLARQIAAQIVRDERYFTIQEEMMPGFPGGAHIQIVTCRCKVLCDTDFAFLVESVRRDVERMRPAILSTVSPFNIPE